MLTLELENHVENIEWTVAQLNFSPKFYKFMVTQSDNIRLIKSYFSVKIYWADGLTILNSALNMPAYLSDGLTVNIWHILKVRRVMDSNYYAVLKVFMLEGDLLKVIILKPMSSVTGPDLRLPTIYLQLN